MGLTLIAFIECQFPHADQWYDVNRSDTHDWLKARKDDAEIHILALDGTFRSLFFMEGSKIILEGNVIIFDSDKADYLLTDHEKNRKTSS